MAAPRAASAFVPAHRWDGYDWGTAPPVPDRLNQGPFPQYPPEEVLPGSEVVMATTPSRAVVPGYGMGLVTYVTGDFGADTFRGVDMEKDDRGLGAVADGPEALRPAHLARAAEAARPPRPGRVLEDDPRDGQAVRQAGRLPRDDERSRHPGAGAAGFRPRQGPHGSRLQGEWKRHGREAERQPPFYEEPRYDHPSFQEAFRELNALLAAELDGSPLVEYMDTFMYGFWGEGHTWPFTNHPFSG